MNNLREEQNKIAEMAADISDYTENAAAVMFYWMEKDETYSELYDQYGDQLGGFVGIQCLAAKAATIFTVEAASYVPGEDYYWIEAIEDFSHKALAYYRTGESPSLEDLHLLASGCIEKCRL